MCNGLVIANILSFFFKTLIGQRGEISATNEDNISSVSTKEDGSRVSSVATKDDGISSYDVDETLPTNATGLDPFRSSIPAPFSEVEALVERNLPELAGPDLVSLKDLRQRAGSDGGDQFRLREYSFTLDDVPSMIQRAIGAETMDIQERCVRKSDKRVSRFSNVSLRSVFEVVVVETYKPHPDAPNEQTIFEVQCAMNIKLPWPVKSVATSFALANYVPKLTEKVARVRDVVKRSIEAKVEAKG